MDMQELLSFIPGMFPATVPAGWHYRCIGNYFDSKRKIMKRAIKTFDFKKQYGEGVYIEIVDAAMDVIGKPLDRMFALYVVYSETANDYDGFEQLREVRQALLQSSRSHSFARQVEQLLKDPQPGPDLGPFWHHYDTLVEDWRN